MAPFGRNMNRVVRKFAVKCLVFLIALTILAIAVAGFARAF